MLDPGQYIMQEVPAAARHFFSGDNVTFMILFGVAALVIILVMVLNHLFDKGDNAITIAQIEADADIKVAQLTAEAQVIMAKRAALTVGQIIDPE